MNLHSWVADNRDSERTPSTPSEEEDEYDERISDFVANTIDNRSTTGLQHQEDRAETANEKSDRRPPHSNRTQLSLAGSTPSVVSEDTFVMHYRERIQMHPQPGNAAKKLNRLVNMPFRAQFGTDSRVQSSRERVVEQQRAASSLKPAFTPLLKDNEPEIILGDDSPRQTLTTNLTRNEQTTQTQQQKPQTSSSIQQPQPTQLRQHFQNEWKNETTSRQPQTRFTDRSTQTQPQPSTQFCAPFQPSPPVHSSPSSPILGHQPRNSATQHGDWRPRTRSLSIADYPPLYDLNRRPRVLPPINVDSWALGVDHYRRMYLDNLVSRIREHEVRHAKLKAKLSCYDKQSKQELDELELMRREQELELRRRQHDERLREQEELERRMAAQTTNNFVAPPTSTQPTQTHRLPPPPPFHSILKKPMGMGKPPLRHTSSFSNSTAAHHHTGGRGVAFSSPIRSVNLYSPNQSRVTSSSMPTDETHQLESEPTCSQNVVAGTTENNQQQFGPSQTNSSLNRRLVLTNKTNHNRPFAHHQTMRNVQNEREKEGKRMDYLNKWQQNRQRLVGAKRYNSRINLNSNPTSIFQHIPSRS